MTTRVPVTGSVVLMLVPFCSDAHAEGGQAGRCAGQVVRVVGADPQLEQAPDR
jgi:hypothetical protein